MNSEGLNRRWTQTYADSVLGFANGFGPKAYFTASGIFRPLKVNGSNSGLRIILICVHLRLSLLFAFIRVHSRSVFFAFFAFFCGYY